MGDEQKPKGLTSEQRGRIGIAVIVAIVVVGMWATGDGADLQGLIFLGVGAALYFAPWLIASRRNVPNSGSVGVINLFLGWTVIGWVVALAMAMRDPRDAKEPPVRPSGEG